MFEYPKVYLYQRIVQAKLYMDQNFGENIDLSLISDEASFSRFHFIRLFKSCYGKTPHQYLKGVRLEKAKLLLQQNHSVTEVCQLVGFESLGSFSNLFRTANGISPVNYLRQQQKLKAATLQQPRRFVPSCFATQNGWFEE